MTKALWYLDKAAECGRLAATTADPEIRASSLFDQKNWTIIAHGIQKDEADAKLRESE